MTNQHTDTPKACQYCGNTNMYHTDGLRWALRCPKCHKKVPRTPLSRLDQWRPIEDAPTATVILGARPSTGGWSMTTVFGYVTDLGACVWELAMQGWTVEGCDIVADWTPTHWMPLPSPPDDLPKPASAIRAREDDTARSVRG